jgi:hypothetical protein
VSPAQDKVDFRLIVDEILTAAQAGFARSKWKIGESYDKLLRPFLGELTVRLGQKLGMDMPPSEEMVRKKVAEELREEAARHPAGSVRRAVMNAADAVEQGPR